MKIAILHHHLNPGGVTQVILNHLRALRIAGPALELSEVLVLHGGDADGFADKLGQDGFQRIRMESVQGLGYDHGGGMAVDDLTQRMREALERFGFGADDTILHVHNHSLGKNVSLPGALRKLAERGYRLLLQIHDFAEDLRPANYQRFTSAVTPEVEDGVGNYLYPNGSHVHYALLNCRDRNIFLQTDIDATRVHLLPNPVTTGAAMPNHEDAQRKFQRAHGLSESSRIVLYPVRGIRRKNLGELLLWSAVAGESFVFALTLPATSENEVPSFERWRRLAEQLKLRVLFNVGLHGGLSFEDNLAAASRIITTSVAEGFGLVFLETWLHQRPLIGRDLPDITQDFKNRGVQLDHLGKSVNVPIEWIGADVFLDRMLILHRQLCDAYRQAVPATTATELSERIAGGIVDFAALPTDQQRAVIERLAGDRSSVDAILDLNPWIRSSLEDQRATWQPLIDTNSAAVRSRFSLDATAADLLSTYRRLIESPKEDLVTALPQPQNILNAFLDVHRLLPVRIEP